MPAGDERLSSQIPMEEVDEFGPNLLSGLATKGDGMCGAVLEVIREKQLFGRSQGRMDRGELLHDLGAVALIFDHAADAVDLAPSPCESIQEVLLRRLADAHRMGRSAGGYGRHDLRWLILYPSIVYTPQDLVKPGQAQQTNRLASIRPRC